MDHHRGGATRADASPLTLMLSFIALPNRVDVMSIILKKRELRHRNGTHPDTLRLGYCVERNGPKRPREISLCQTDGVERGCAPCGFQVKGDRMT